MLLSVAQYSSLAVCRFSPFRLSVAQCRPVLLNIAHTATARAGGRGRLRPFTFRMGTSLFACPLSPPSAPSVTPGLPRANGEILPPLPCTTTIPPKSACEKSCRPGPRLHNTFRHQAFRRSEIFHSWHLFSLPPAPRRVWRGWPWPERSRGLVQPCLPHPKARGHGRTQAHALAVPRPCRSVGVRVPRVNKEQQVAAPPSARRGTAAPIRLRPAAPTVLRPPWNGPIPADWQDGRSPPQGAPRAQRRHRDEVNHGWHG